MQIWLKVRTRRGGNLPQRHDLHLGLEFDYISVSLFKHFAPWTEEISKLYRPFFVERGDNLIEKASDFGSILLTKCLTGASSTVGKGTVYPRPGRSDVCMCSRLHGEILKTCCSHVVPSVLADCWRFRPCSSC